MTSTRVNAVLFTLADVWTGDLFWGVTRSVFPFEGEHSCAQRHLTENQNMCAAASAEGEGDWGQHGEKALCSSKSPLWPFPPALPLFSASQRWHWRRPGMQKKNKKKPPTCLTCRPSQNWLQRFCAISDPFLCKGTNLAADPLITGPRCGSIFSCFCRIIHRSW